MTLKEAARDFLDAHGSQPWLTCVVLMDDRLQVWTTYELPRALRERLSPWRGHPVEFKVTGRICRP